MTYRSASVDKQQANALEVWDQILRTEEELMEIGTMGNALLLGHSIGIDCVVKSREAVKKRVV